MLVKDIRVLATLVDKYQYTHAKLAKLEGC